MWYIADARPGAELYAGLRSGVTRAEFERKINTARWPIVFIAYR
jgi:hypothetical protein